MFIPIRFLVQYLFLPSERWFAAPLLQLSYSWTHFQIEENGQEVDGFKQSLGVHGGFRILIERASGDPNGFKQLFFVDSAFFNVIVGYEIPIASDGFDISGFYFGPEVGFIF